jgi:hypothetical protein
MQRNLLVFEAERGTVSRSHGKALTHADRCKAGNRQRKKLWELGPHFHCLVIGTCFTIEELSRLGRKAGISVGERMSDYELHHNFVQVARNPVVLARLMHKCLDRKFDTLIRRFSACKQAGEIESLWEDALRLGDVAAAFWALVTHPLASSDLLDRAYGEVHMLSHIAGHTNHSARQELVALKGRVSELEEALAWTASATRLRVQELEHRAERVDTLERELEVARNRLAALECGETVERLRAENAALTARLARALERADAAERKAEAVAQRTDPPPTRSNLGKTTPARASAPTLQEPLDICSDVDRDLRGRRILYVGGRERQIAHFCAVVERRNGEFLHHDGGRSENVTRLDSMIRAADAVLCPIECVSHDACARIKRICKRAAKPFVPLRSASLAGFVEGLRTVAA